MSTYSSLSHPSLQSTLQGVQVADVVQFRGVPYGQISKRFAAAELIDQIPSSLDCTRYGPKCPQIHIDPGHLLRIPPNHELPVEAQDEFKCTNLDIVLPRNDLVPSGKRLPVLVWIHGGSQAVTFGNAASGIADMTKIVSDSIRMKKPIIAVSINYRLNVFALGDGVGPSNLALRDQALALDWVQRHISGFGGDPDSVTLAGESAGGVYCHANLATGSPAKQFIMASGTLALSPPQPPHVVASLRDAVSKQLKSIDASLDLNTAPAAQVVEAIELSGIQSWVMQWEDRFDNWESKTGNARAVMLSDVQNEAVIWRRGIWSTDVNDIVRAFDLAGSHSQGLKQLYHIYPDRPTSSRTGALDFVHDYKFLLPITRLIQSEHWSGIPIYRYLVDEANPWQPSSGAHHAVDVLLLFGGFDEHLPEAARITGRNMREAWIKYVNEEQPWQHGSATVAFGPYGSFQAVKDWELESRRRMRETDQLGKMDRACLDKVFYALVAGKVRLLN